MPMRKVLIGNILVSAYVSHDFVFVTQKYNHTSIRTRNFRTSFQFPLSFLCISSLSLYLCLQYFGQLTQNNHILQQGYRWMASFLWDATHTITITEIHIKYITTTPIKVLNKVLVSYESMPLDHIYRSTVYTSVPQRKTSRIACFVGYMKSPC